MHLACCLSVQAPDSKAKSHGRIEIGVNIPKAGVAFQRLGGWPHNMSALGQRMFLVDTVLCVLCRDAGNMYRRGARRWRKLYRVNGHLFQAKRFSRVSEALYYLEPQAESDRRIRRQIFVRRKSAEKNTHIQLFY